MADLLSTLRPAREEIAPGLVVLAGFADTAPLYAEVQAIAAAAPFRRLTTPGGRTMAVAMTNCGPLGWVSDRAGYRYAPDDPQTARPWPAMPGPFADLARRAADAAGLGPFAPDACLVNRYAPGTGLGAHQDRDEADFAWPIVQNEADQRRSKSSETTFTPVGTASGSTLQSEPASVKTAPEKPISSGISGSGKLASAVPAM